MTICVFFSLAKKDGERHVKEKCFRESKANIFIHWKIQNVVLFIALDCGRLIFFTFHFTSYTPRDGKASQFQEILKSFQSPVLKCRGVESTVLLI
jgi:hypothetical protein